MKKILFICISAMYIAPCFASNTIKIKGCSGYLKAEKEIHRRSAISDYRDKAFDVCESKGFTSWTSIRRKWDKGLRHSDNLQGFKLFSCFGLSGTVKCHN